MIVIIKLQAMFKNCKIVKFYNSKNVGIKTIKPY